MTVDDLQDFERAVETRLCKMAAALQTASLQESCPKEQNKERGGTLRFSKPSEEWKETKVWEFTLIQSLVNLLTTTYGITPIKIENATVRVSRAIKCAVTCGFFNPGACTTKAHIDAHLREWLPELHRSSFIVYMATLQSILGCSTHPAKDHKDLRKFYKLSKSALQNGHFSEAAATSLGRIENKLVKKEE